jgi:hypothetical protein
MATFPDQAWFSEFQARVNQDKELSVIGNWFSTRFSITVDDSRRVLVVNSGQITQCIMAPRFDSRPVFGFRAPMAIWQKFLTPNALQRLMNLMRKESV